MEEGVQKGNEEKTSPTATPSRSYVLGLRVEGQNDAANDTVYLLIDGHGSTRALVDLSSGNTVERYDYDAFGKLINGEHSDLAATPTVRSFSADSAATSWLFGGDGVYDPSTGWTYQLTRWRDDFRFTSYDFNGDPASPSMLHKYVYANGDPVRYSDPTGMFSLSELVVDMGITSVIGSIASPILAPAARYIGDAIANSLLGDSVDSMLKVIGSAPPAVMLGVDISGGYGTGGIDFQTGASLEALISPSFTAGYFAWNFLSISAGGNSSGWKGAVSAKAGLVFGADTPEDYSEWFMSLTVPLASIPLKLRQKIVEWSGSVVSQVGAGVAGMAALGPAAGRWIPQARSAFDELQSLTADLSWLNNAISSSKSLSSYVTIFWDPKDADPIGFDFAAGFSNTGSTNITGSYYLQL